MAMVVIVGLFSLAATANLDNSRTRVKCASNLRQIGEALLLYSNDSKGPFPRTKYDVGTADHPTAYTGGEIPDPFSPQNTQANDVSAALYLLLRTEDITSAVFICPATSQRPFTYGGGIHTALDKSNFPDGSGLSYSYTDPYPNQSAREAGYSLRQGLHPDFAVMADMNPGSPELLQITTGSPKELIRKANSLNHSTDGQNILYGDGHVEFQNSPLAGVNRDNIYTYGRSGADPNTQAALPTGGLGVFGSPIGPDDSVLLPAAVMPAAMPVAAATVSPPSGPAGPPAAAVPPVDEGTDFTTIFVVASLVFLIVLLAALTVVVLRKRRPKTEGESAGPR
jgi:prepilin-type processing-associated H-X9-DG protein